jgi:hypothetical protein
MTSASASRVSRSSRSLRLTLVLFAGVLAAASVLRAQEMPPAAPVPTPAPAPAEPAPAETRPAESTTGESPAETNPPAPADRTRPVGPTPGRFEPTEKVRADFDVAFPIDI